MCKRTCHFTYKLSLFLQQYDRFDRHIHEKERENGYDFQFLWLLWRRIYKRDHLGMTTAIPMLISLEVHVRFFFHI